MKLFISGARLRFTMLILFVLTAFMITATPPVRGQGQSGTATAYSYSPYVSKFTAYSQMWNISSVYFNSVTVSNIGNQLDTLINTATLQLSTSRWGTGFVNADTFTYAPVNGVGSITLSANGLKCTGSPTVTIFPERSADGIHWAPITGVVTVTVVPTSLTVPVEAEFTFTDNRVGFYRLNITGSGSSTTSWYADYFFKAAYILQKNSL